MKEITDKRTHRKHTILKALGITLLAFFMLVSIAGAAPYAYVTNSGDNTVSVIDTATNKVTTTVNVGNSPFGVAVSPDGSKAYVTNSGSSTVSVIDTATNTVIATVPVENSPLGVAITPDGTKVYVASQGSQNVSVIDTATNNVIATVLAGNSQEVAISPDGKKAYVTNTFTTFGSSSNIKVIDTDTNIITASINLYGIPSGVAFNPDGTKIYVTQAIQFQDGFTTGDHLSVEVINTTTNNVTSGVYLGDSTPGGAICPGVATTPDGKKAYVTCYYNVPCNTVFVIDTATTTVAAKVTVGTQPYGVSVTPDGTKVYVANTDGNVSVIDTAKNNVTSTIKVGKFPRAVGQFIGTPPAQKVLPVANFTANVTQGYAPLDVQFNDSSLNATHLEWIFGDNSDNVSDANPEHLFMNTGLFNVVLTASNTNGTSSISKTINVTAKPVPPMYPVANFTVNVTQGYAPLDVQFTDLSTNATGWNWDFGDGANSTQQNPVHVYSKPGNYNVNLTVTNGNKTDSKYGIITVQSASTTGTYAYIPSYDTVSVIDTSTNTVTDTVNVGNNPIGVAVSPDGTKVYVVNENSDNVSVIDTTTNNVTATVNVGDQPYGVAVTPDGTKVYVANNRNNTVSVIDTSTNTVTDTVNVGNNPIGVAVTPDGKKVYVANLGSYNISVIDTSTDNVTDNVYLGFRCYGVAVNPDGTKVYVTLYRYDGAVDEIDTTSNNVTATWNVGFYPSGVAVTPDGKKVYVTNSQDTTVSVIDIATDIATTTGTVFNGGGVAVTPDGKKVYVVGAGNLYEIDTATNNLTYLFDRGFNNGLLGQFICSVPAPVLPVANFKANVTQGYAPLDVQFNDSSRNATHLEWNFGDNNGNTSIANPEHVFNSTGNFNVVLTASNGNGSDSKSMTINVTSKQVLRVFPGCTNLPTDLNNDGLYEDINGNGRLDFADVVTYFNNMAWITQNGLVTYFDYNNNGRIDFSDVVNLFKMKSS